MYHVHNVVLYVVVTLNISFMSVFNVQIYTVSGKKVSLYFQI